MRTKPENRPKKRSDAKTAAKKALPVVHFEIIGKDPEKLRKFYGSLFGWKFDTAALVAKAISQEGNYGFISCTKTNEGVGIPGGIGGGSEYHPHAVFYIGVPNVEAALRRAEKLGGKRRLGPVTNPDGSLAVGHFNDPEGQMIGIAGPA